MCSSNFVFACTQHLYSFHYSSCCNELPVPVLLTRTWVSRPRNWRQNTFKDRFRLRGAREHKTKKSNATKCESLEAITSSSHPYHLSCYCGNAIYFRTDLCPNSVSSLSPWRC